MTVEIIEKNNTVEVIEQVSSVIVSPTGTPGSQGTQGAPGVQGDMGQYGSYGSSLYGGGVEPGLGHSIPVIWNNISLLNGWTGILKWSVDVNGFIHLRGQVNASAATSEVINTISSIAPTTNMLFYVTALQSLGTFTQLAIGVDTSGNILVATESAGIPTAINISFDGLSFTTA